ncbi:phage baseplate protein, partial [Acidaminococcus fermentans]|uniref:phage baseplate protein n=1 Tax=Acidaminococcus fermentans TaxID=905 RepID=UPI003C6DA972
MTTRAIVPNGDGEGSLGTASAKWGAVYSSDPASGENSGQVPTTAWVQKLLADALAKQKEAYEQAISTAVSAAKTQAKLDAHPVGSYYWSNDSASPASLFGGTWEALPAGYTLIAQGSGSDSLGSYTYTAGQKYGERKHQLTTDEMPSHSHTLNRNSNS